MLAPRPGLALSSARSREILQSLLSVGNNCSPAKTTSPESIGLYFGTVFAGASSPALIFIQFYYYNSTGTFDLNLSSILSIDASELNFTLFDGSRNFTLTTSQN